MIDPNLIDHEETLPGSAHTSLLIRRGRLLRLTDIEGGANVGMLFYNPTNPTERYNAPDTLKSQHTFRIGLHNCLYSDMGRIFCSIVEDTVGWHDTVGGNSTAASIAARWGELTYQQARNDRRQNGTDSFLIEAAKYGLSRRDIPANLNWFSRIAVAEEGRLVFTPLNSKPGDHITLRFEMDTLVLLHTCAHPMDTTPEYPSRPIRLQLAPAAPVADDDPCRISRPENRRGFENNRLYHLGAYEPV